MPPNIDRQRRTVIVVMEDADRRQQFHLDEGPDDSVPTRRSYPLRLDQSQADLSAIEALKGTKQRVRQVGRRITKALMRHPDVARALTTIQTARLEPDGPRAIVYPIFLQLESSDAENIPWEALWFDQIQRFAALHEVTIPLPAGSNREAVTVPLWPFGRLAAPTRRVQKLERYVDGTLRVTAVLSAAGIPADTEFLALCDTLLKLGERIRIQVLLSEDSLAARAAILNDPRIQVEFLGGERKNFLLGKIQAFGPNILHFFCHGASHDVPHIELATRSDWYTGADIGSIRLQSQDLQPFGALDSLCLVTLNCCQGARPSGSVRSLARQLVADGVPAVVAMREPIDRSHASQFSSAFYAALADELRDVIDELHRSAKDGHREPYVVPDDMWARAVQPSRYNIVYRTAPGEAVYDAAANIREWTVPILYVHRADLELYLRSPANALTDEQRAKIRQTIAALRTSRDIQAAAGAPRDIIAAIDRMIAEHQRLVYEPDTQQDEI